MQFFNQQNAAPPPAAAGLAPPPNAPSVAAVPPQGQPSAQPPVTAGPPAAGLAPQSNAPQPAPGFNDFADFALKRATIDARYGKTDGAGLINLYNGIKKLKDEGFASALNKMDTGNVEEGFAEFNQTGKTRKEFVSVKEGVFDFNGAKIPTRLVTYRNQDGSISTLNTAQARTQLMTMDKIISTAQEGRKIGQEDTKLAETKRHNKATEESGRITAQARKTAAEAKLTEKGSLTQKDGLNVLKERYGGKFEGGVWFPDEKNKDVGMRAMQIYEQKITANPKMGHIEAATQSVGEAEREKAQGKTPPFLKAKTTDQPGDTGKEGKKDFRTLWSQ